MRARDIWFEIHKYAGLATLAFLLVASLTGCLLVFRSPLDASLNPDLFRTRPAPALPPAELVRRVEAQRPRIEVTRLPLFQVPGRTAMLTVDGRDGGRLAYDQLFVDPADGHVLGQRRDAASWSRRGLMRGVYDLHSTLVAGTPGRWIMGVAAGVWLGSNLVGVYLTLPARRPFWRAWRPLWSVSLRARLPRVLLDLHRASGLWLSVALTIMAFTSVALNFYYELAEPAALALFPAQPSPFDSGRPRPAPDRRPNIGWARALAIAEADARRRAPGWRAVDGLYAPRVGAYGITLTRSGREDYAGLGPIALYYRDADGSFLYRDDPARDGPGRAFLRSLYPLHSGEVFGWTTRAVVLLTGVATAEQALTGVYLWLKRRGPRAAAARRARA